MYEPLTQQGARPSQSELRDQIRAITQEARAAAQEAARDAQLERGVRVGQPMPPVPPVPPFPGGGFTIQTGDGFGPNAIPPQAVDIAMGFFIMCAVIVIGWPLARAFGRRLERRGDVATISPAVTDQLQRIEHAVEAMSVEVERISESQRFMARLQNVAPPERVGPPAERS